MRIINTSSPNPEGFSPADPEWIKSGSGCSAVRKTERLYPTACATSFFASILQGAYSKESTARSASERIHVSISLPSHEPGLLHSRMRPATDGPIPGIRSVIRLPYMRFRITGWCMHMPKKSSWQMDTENMLRRCGMTG